MLQIPNFRKFRISEFIQFFLDILTIITQNYPNKEKITEEFNALQKVLDYLQASYKRKTSSKLTIILASLDKRRDNAIICLSKIADGYLSHFNEEKKKAAQTILDCIDKYGSKIYALNYQAETSVLSNLGEDFNTIEELLAALVTLNLTEVKDEMITANDLFNEKYIDRVEEDADDDQESSTKIIEEAKVDYKKLMKLIDAYATISKTDEFDLTINRLNSLISRYNSTMALRHNSKAEDTSTEENI